MLDGGDDVRDGSKSDDHKAPVDTALLAKHGRPVETLCYTSQLPLRSGVGRRLAVEPLVEGRTGGPLSERLAPVPMYSISNRSLGIGMTSPRTGLV